MQFLHLPSHVRSRLVVEMLENVGITEEKTSALSQQGCTSKPNSRNQYRRCMHLTRRRELLELPISLLLPVRIRYW